jgi:hypothetical protein
MPSVICFHQGRTCIDALFPLIFRGLYCYGHAFIAAAVHYIINFRYCSCYRRMNICRYKPELFAIICPVFTMSPFFTTGSEGAPICWETGMLTDSGKGKYLNRLAAENLFSADELPPFEMFLSRFQFNILFMTHLFFFINSAAATFEPGTQFQ